MRSVLDVVDRAIHGLNYVVGWLIAAILAVMTILITWQVFARYVIGSPLTFSEEIARFGLVWMTMLGAGYAFRYGTLISIDIVAEVASEAVRRFVEVFVVLASVLFAYVLLIEGWNLAERVSIQTAPSTRVSMAWLYSAMPVGAAMILVNAVALLIDQTRPGGRSAVQGERAGGE